MKKIILFTVVCLMSFNSFIFGQLPTEAVINQQYTYTVSSTPVATSYGWTLSGGSTTAAAVNASTGNTVTYTWDAAVLNNNYTLTVYGILNGCSGDDFIKTYKIVNQLSYSASWVKEYNTCPATTKNPGGGVDAAFDLQITINTGAALTTSDNVTVNFTVSGESVQSATVKPDVSGVVKIPVNFANKTNTTGADIVKNVLVTSVTIQGRNPISIPDASRPSGSVTIYATPVINDIF